MTFSSRMMTMSVLSALLFSSAGCGGTESPSDSGPVIDASTDAGMDSGTDAGAADAGWQEYAREARGEPVSSDEISAITAKYIELLKYMDYFKAMDDRVHGWPESDPSGYWYGTWWSGLSVEKKGGTVTFLHGENGSDNNGMRVAPMLSGAVYAWKLWKKPLYQHLARKIIRGFNSWILAMGVAGDLSPVLMTRAHYPASVLSTDGGRSLFIDYSLNRPGLDNGACKYVHIKDNPYWGDIWSKNMRSKDDIGHMYTEIPLVGEMLGLFDDDGLKADYARLIELYTGWSKRVEADGFTMATFDKDLNVYIPPDDLAHFISFENAECPIIMAIRIMGAGDPGEWKCGNGISAIDDIISVKPDNAQQLRSFHQAGTAWARHIGRNDITNKLLSGLARRMDRILDAKEGPKPPADPIDQDVAEAIIMSGNVGLPLTWREVRYLHARLRDTADSFIDPSRLASYKLFDNSTPDGKYPYDIEGRGLHFRHMGTLLGLCASPYRNSTSMPALDCEMLEKAGL